MFRNLRPVLTSTLPSILAAAILVCALPAHAIGRAADIQLIDRDSGATLTVYRRRGEYWVAGRPGARYAVSVRSLAPGRVLGVVSVDGVNVVSGETAAWNQTGYVLNPWQRYDITGWRKSDNEIAAFHFTALPSSYAARTGRPDHVGVIGVALFLEREELPAVAPAPNRNQAESAGSLADAESQPSAPAAAPRLGTGHGGREFDQVGHTQFERRSARPDEVIRIRYDSRENLMAMGVLPPPWRSPRPDAFPGSDEPGYVPDPR